MVRRKGELTIAEVKRDWPICIVVSRDLWGPVLPLMSRHTALRDSSATDENGEQLVVLYLRDQAAADHIMNFCDGWQIDAKQNTKRLIRRGREQTLHVGPDISRSQRRPFWPPAGR